MLAGRVISALASAALMLAGASCSAPASPSAAPPEILELTQGAFSTGDFPLQVERRDETRVLGLRRQENLDAVVMGARGEMEVFERLTAWARAQFEPGVPEPYPLSNGLSILADIRSGKTGGFCGQYSYLLGDALKSLGYFAVRYVELESESAAGHFAVEAWCDDLGRWVLLDPLNLALFESEGVPLSAVEVHDLLLGGKAGAVRVRRIPPLERGRGDRARREPEEPRVARPGSGASHPPPDADTDLVALFYNVASSTRNDFARLEHPLTIAEREGIFLRYKDPRVAPFRHLDFGLTSMRRDDFLTPMNQVAIEVRPGGSPGHLRIVFSTRGTCPHFARYRIRIGDGPWRDTGPLQDWTLAPGENRLEVRAVNALEVQGPVFRIRVRS